MILACKDGPSRTFKNLDRAVRFAVGHVGQGQRVNVHQMHQPPQAKPL